MMLGPERVLGERVGAMPAREPCRNGTPPGCGLDNKVAGCLCQTLVMMMVMTMMTMMMSAMLMIVRVMMMMR